MKKYSFLVALIFIISGNIFSQSTYSGNLSISDESFFKGYSDSDGYYVGGCNAFPIGTFVNVKLPYSDDSVDVKIVTRIPEDGIFVLIEKRAGEKLDLGVGDVLPVRIQVVDFIPLPLSGLDEDEEFNPKPELKGLTALSVGDEEATEEIIEPESDVADTKLANEFSDLDIVDSKVDLVVPESNSVSSELENHDLENTADMVSPELDVLDSGKDSIVLESDIVISEKEISVDKAVIDEKEHDKVEKKDNLSEPVIVSDEIEPIIYEDELPGESMFLVEDEIDTENITEEPIKSVKRVFFLEPANSKPPEGGIPDSELIPVTTVDENRFLKDGFYLQVGIYSSDELILKDAERLEKLNFPYIKVREKVSPERERLLVGPLRNDELGVIMLNLKGRGFADFFRYRKK